MRTTERETFNKAPKTHRPDRLWRVTPLKTEVRDVGPREFFFSSVAACTPPDEVAADDVSTIFATIREDERGLGVGWKGLCGRTSAGEKESSLLSSAPRFPKKAPEISRAALPVLKRGLPRDYGVNALMRSLSRLCA